MAVSTNDIANELTACHDCDLLHRVEELPRGGVAKCSRCGAVLYRHRVNSLDRTLTLIISSFVFYLLANVYPFMSFRLEGRVQTCTIFTGVVDLWSAGMWFLASLVFFASMLAPLLKILGLLYLLVPLRLDRLPWDLELSHRIVHALHPWGMLDVYMLGVLVAIIKLSGLATIDLGIAFHSLVALMVLTTAATVTLDPQDIWERLEVRR